MWNGLDCIGVQLEVSKGVEDGRRRATPEIAVRLFQEWPARKA